MKKALLLLLVAMVALSGCLTACGEKKPSRLPAVETQGLPAGDELKSTVVVGGFTIGIHETYAEIVGYDGNDTELIIPDSAAGVSVMLIAEGAFQNNTRIVKVKLPASTRIVDRFAFEGCTALAEVIFNDGLETVGDYAFRDSGLTALNLPDSVVEIGKYSFYHVNIKELRIPDSVSRMGKYAFGECSSLQSITFCPRLYEIGECLFYNCTSLAALVLPKTVEELGDYAFGGCTGLKRIVVSSETVKIGEGVFAGCDGLTICAPSGSAAEKNAKRNGYRFEAVNYEDAAKEIAG